MNELPKNSQDWTPEDVQRAADAATLPILTYPNDILRKRSAPIGEVTDEMRLLAANMFATMRIDNGIGLAAPQVGSNVRMITIETIYVDKDGWSLVMINPVIKKREGSFIMEEGCLSVPGVYCEVKRADKIKVEWRNLLGEKQTETFRGITAVCIQHEIDHLEGRLLVDYLPEDKKEQK